MLALGQVQSMFLSLFIVLPSLYGASLSIEGAPFFTTIIPKGMIIDEYL